LGLRGTTLSGNNNRKEKRMKFNISLEELNSLTFGVEIETTIPRSSGINVGTYSTGHPLPEAAPKFNGVTWKAHEDGSIRVNASGHTGCEFVSPVLKGEEGLKHIVDFMKWLRSTGAKVNRTTGTHVHVGVKSVIGNADMETVLNWIVKVGELGKKYSTGLYASTGTTRNLMSTTSYCVPLGDVAKDAFKFAKRTNCKASGLSKIKHDVRKYSMINFTNVGSGKHTVEFRAFAGTTNTAKMLNHITCSMAIALLAKHNMNKSTVWKDYSYTGVAGFGFIWKYATKLIKLTSLKGKWNHKCRMWGMAMAAKWDRKMGNGLIDAGVRATRWVRERG